MPNKSPEGGDAAPPEDSLESPFPVDAQPLVETTQEETAEPAEVRLSPGGLRLPSQIKDALSPEEMEEKDRVVQQGFTTGEGARKRILKDRYIPASPPEDAQPTVKAREIKIDRRKLSAGGKRQADTLPSAGDLVSRQPHEFEEPSDAVAEGAAAAKRHFVEEVDERQKQKRLDEAMIPKEPGTDIP